MGRKNIIIVFIAIVGFGTPGHARAEQLEEIVSFYAQGAGDGISAIADGLALASAELTHLSPPVTRTAVNLASTTAEGILAVIETDPAVRHVLAQIALSIGKDAGLRGQGFLEAMRSSGTWKNLGKRVWSLSNQSQNLKSGAASVEALITLGGLAIITASSAIGIYEYYKVYEAELPGNVVDQEAYNNNVRLLLERMRDNRINLCPGINLSEALSLIRRNSDAGQLPFLGVLDRCHEIKCSSSDKLNKGSSCTDDGVFLTNEGNNISADERLIQGGMVDVETYRGKRTWKYRIVSHAPRNGVDLSIYFKDEYGNFSLAVPYDLQDSFFFFNFDQYSRQTLRLIVNGGGRKAASWVLKLEKPRNEPYKGWMQLRGWYTSDGKFHPKDYSRERDSTAKIVFYPDVSR